MTITYRFCYSTAAVPIALLLLSLPAVMAFGPLHSEQSGSAATPNVPAGAVTSDCSKPQPQHRPPQVNNGIRVCTFAGGFFNFHTLQFGLAAHKAFTAEMSGTSWRSLPADKTERRELKKKLRAWKTSHDGTKLTIAHGPFSIARDSAGRVLQSDAWSGSNVSTSTSYSSGTLCDPLTERMTSFSMADPLPPRAGQSFALSAGDNTLVPFSRFTFEKPGATWVPLHEDIYRTRRWVPADKGWKVVDLGYQEMNGIRAHGHRWWYAPEGNFVQGDFRELWISEDLDVDVLFIDESQTKGKGTRVELTHVRLKEPDHSWFEIPEGVPAKVLADPKKPLPDPCPATSPGN